MTTLTIILLKVTVAAIIIIIANSVFNSVVNFLKNNKKELIEMYKFIGIVNFIIGLLSGFLVVSLAGLIIFLVVCLIEDNTQTV